MLRSKASENQHFLSQLLLNGGHWFCIGRVSNRVPSLVDASSYVTSYKQPSIPIEPVWSDSNSVFRDWEMKGLFRGLMDNWREFVLQILTLLL